MSDLRPNNSEVEFLILAYGQFYDLFEEIFQEEFWGRDSYYRFSKVKDAFSIYSELLNYEPIKWAIEDIKRNRPPMEGEIGSELFKFLRNLFAHFPFFNCWDEVWISKSIAIWYKEGQSMDRFLEKYVSKGEVKYRFWERENKKMTYLTISFPKEYKGATRIYLKDILSEKEGVKFSLILMRKIIDTQVIKD